MKFTYKVTVEPNEDMGMDDPEGVKDLIEECLCDGGMDNGANVKVELLTEE